MDYVIASLFIIIMAIVLGAHMLIKDLKEDGLSTGLIIRHTIYLAIPTIAIMPLIKLFYLVYLMETQ